MRIWPTARQFAEWTLPSKASFVGAIAGLVALPIGIVALVDSRSSESTAHTAETAAPEEASTRQVGVSGEPATPIFLDAEPEHLFVARESFAAQEESTTTGDVDLSASIVGGREEPPEPSRHIASQGQESATRAAAPESRRELANSEVKADGDGDPPDGSSRDSRIPGGDDIVSRITANDQSTDPLATLDDLIVSLLLRLPPLELGRVGTFCEGASESDLALLVLNEVETRLIATGVRVAQRISLERDWETRPMTLMGERFKFDHVIVLRLIGSSDVLRIEARLVSIETDDVVTMAAVSVPRTSELGVAGAFVQKVTVSRS